MNITGLVSTLNLRKIYHKNSSCLNRRLKDKLKDLIYENKIRYYMKLDWKNSYGIEEQKDRKSRMHKRKQTTQFRNKFRNY